MKISESETSFFKRSIQLALEAGEEGNLPIGAVITLDDEIVSEGRNAIWYPRFNPNRHAEIEALRNVPEELWQSKGEMSLYTTLEPCLMCVGAILLHHIGRVVYGSADDYGGAGLVFGHMPKYFEEELSRIEWIGPAYEEECDKLFLRVMQLVMERREKEN
jgi:tRNA(adenine34) deaminase